MVFGFWFFCCGSDIMLAKDSNFPVCGESLPPIAQWVGVEDHLLLWILTELKVWAACLLCTDMFWGMLGSTALCACASVKIIGASGVGHSENKDCDDCVLAVGCLRGDWTLSVHEELHNSWPNDR